MAEFLVHGRVPLDLLIGAAVHSKDHEARVERMFGSEVRLPVLQRPGWYFS
jgi:hypothetical protein